MLSQTALLAHFKGITGSGEQRRCKCPAHDDKEGSLSISLKPDKILLNCHAGCKTEDILRAAGLSWEDIGAEKKNLSYTWKDRLLYGFNQHNGGGWVIHDIYDYTDANRNYLYSKVRFSKPGENKKIRFYQIDRKNDDYTSGRGLMPPTLYNLPDFLRTVRDGKVVYYVEGEKDVETLRKIGLTATTAGGADEWKPYFARYFKSAKLIILPDNDEPGGKAASMVKWSVWPYAYWTQTHVISKLQKGDVTDYLEKENGTKLDIIRLTEQGELDLDVRHYAPWIDAEPVMDKKTHEVTDVKIYLNADKLARTFSETNYHWICRKYNEEKDLFFLYSMERGLYEGQNTNGLKAEIKKYLPLGNSKDSFLVNTAKLLLADTEKTCNLEDFDCDPDYINLKNGLYSVKDKALISHSPDRKSRIQLNARYNAKITEDDFKKSRWYRYISDLCRDPEGNVDLEKHAVLQEFAGLAISNYDMSKLKKMLILMSHEGNTGKSVYLRTLQHLIGEMRVESIKLKDINPEKRFSLGNLKNGIRLIVSGDESRTTIEDSSVLKELTGGDTTKTEAKGRQQEPLKYRGGIAVCCNELPSIKDDKGNHMFGRMLIIPCENVIPESKQDPDLSDKLEKESDIILLWALRGLHRYLENKRLSYCKSSERATREYRADTDTLYRFISEKYVITRNREDMVSKPDFEKAYLEWCDSQKPKLQNVNPRGIKNRMIGYGCRADKTRHEGKVGVMVYRCIRLKTVQEQEFEDAESEVPFDDDNTFT